MNKRNIVKKSNNGKHNKQEIILYIIFGVLTTAVYFCARFLVLKLSNNSMSAVIIAQISAILFAFITNKIFVFIDKNWQLIYLIRQFLIFIIGRATVFLIDVVFTYLFIVQLGDFFIQLFSLEQLNYSSFVLNNPLMRHFIGTPHLLMEFIFVFIIQVVAVIVNYIISKCFVFNKSDISSSNS